MKFDAKPRMYPERKANLNPLIGCDFKCIYCAFAPLQARFGKCPKCKTFTPHEHPEAFNKAPPKTKDNEFITIGLNGDLSFASDELMQKIGDYCYQYSDRTFVLQTKNPACFLNYQFSKNVIIGTTIETDYFTFPMNETIHRSYRSISAAPRPVERYEAMCEIKARKIVTIEPIMFFDSEVLKGWIEFIKPEAVYIGYNSQPYRHKLPEPSLKYVQAFIESLKGITEVRTKLLRPATWETDKSCRADKCRVCCHRKECPDCGWSV